MSPQQQDLNIGPIETWHPCRFCETLLSDRLYWPDENCCDHRPPMSSFRTWLAFLDTDRDALVTNSGDLQGTEEIV